MTTIVVSPHLDDAVLSTFSYLGADATVVNIFCAEPPDGILSLWDRITGATSSAERARERIVEDSNVLARHTGADVVYLDRRERYDALVRDAIRSSGSVPVETDPEILAVELAALVSDGDLVLGPLAAADQPNPDHRIAREAVRILARGWYGSPDVAVALYADYPHAVKSRAAWPRELVVDGKVVDSGYEPAPGDDLHVKLAEKPPGWLARLRRELPEIDPIWCPLVRFLPPAVRDAKRAAMEGYRTQFRALDRLGRKTGLVTDPELYGVEIVLPIR